MAEIQKRRRGNRWVSGGGAILAAFMLTSCSSESVGQGGGSDQPQKASVTSTTAAPGPSQTTDLVDAHGDKYSVTYEISAIKKNVQNDGTCSEAYFPSGSTIIAVKRTIHNPNQFTIDATNVAGEVISAATEGVALWNLSTISQSARDLGQYLEGPNEWASANAPDCSSLAPDVVIGTPGDSLGSVSSGDSSWVLLFVVPPNGTPQPQGFETAPPYFFDASTQSHWYSDKESQVLAHLPIS